MTRPPATPFGVLGLPASRDLTDDDVRAAWRRIAAATHPDRLDGGDPARFAAASAAYAVLRTPAGRGETLAAGEPGAAAAPRPAGGQVPAGVPRVAPPGAPGARELAPVAAGTPRYPAGPAGPLTRAVTRVTRGRPAMLAARILIVAAAGTVSAVVAGPVPATPALITGALTWFVLTARHDLAPPS
jgi:hypothetical protein